MRNIRRISKKYGLRQIVTFFLVCCMFCNPAVLAEVVWDSTQAGAINVDPVVGGTTQAMSASDGAVGTFSNFNIANGLTVTCTQPGGAGSNANALFKVDSESGTEIFGTFTANGNIYLQNINGILIGSTGVINTNQFIGSTVNITMADWQAFVSGVTTELRFAKVSGEDPTGVMENRGTITASKVYLIGSQVLNNGTINAPDTLVMAAGEKIYLTHEGSKVLIKVPTDLVTPDPATNKVDIDAASTINAGQVVLAAGDVFTAALDVGSLAATANRDITLEGAVTATGDIALLADADVWGGGDMTADGAITAGGNVDITGNFVTLNDDVTANGGDLTITGRTSRSGWYYEESLEPEDEWGYIDVAENKMLGASHDVILKDAYGSGGDEEPPAGEMDLFGHGGLTIMAHGGSIQTQGPFGEGVKITVENLSPAFLGMTQADSLNLADYSFGNQNNTALYLNSINGSITAVDSSQSLSGKNENAADQWASIEAYAYTDITLQGHDASRDITAGTLISYAAGFDTGNITVTSDNSKVLLTKNVVAHQGSVAVTAIDGGIVSSGHIKASDGITLFGEVTADASVDQIFDAGQGTLWAKDTLSTITKTGTGGLTLGGDTLVNLDGIDGSTGDSVWVQAGPLTIEDSLDAEGNLKAQGVIHLQGTTNNVAGDILSTGSGILIDHDVDADGVGDQVFDAGTGQLIAENEADIDKITAGSLTLAGDAGIELGGNVTGTGMTSVDSLTFENNVNADGTGAAQDQRFDAGLGALDADGSIAKTTDGKLNLGGEEGIELGGNVGTHDGDLTLEDAVTANGGNQTFDADGAGKDLIAADDIIKNTAGNLTLGAGTQPDAQIELAGDVTTTDGHLTLWDKVVANGTGNQVFDADGTGKDLIADDDIIKTTAGNLTLGAGTQPDAQIELPGDVTVTDGDLTFWDQVIANGSGNQKFAAVTGKLLATDDITKTTTGNLEIFGGYNGPLHPDMDYSVHTQAVTVDDGELSIAGNATVRLDGSIYSKGKMTLAANADGILSTPSSPTSNPPLVSYDNLIHSSGTIQSLNGDVDLSGINVALNGGSNPTDAYVSAGGDILLRNYTWVQNSRKLDAGDDIVLAEGKRLQGNGSLSLIAGDDIIIGSTDVDNHWLAPEDDTGVPSEVKANGDLILNAVDDVYVHGELITLDGSGGDIEITASDDTIHLYGNVTADQTDGGDIILHANTEVADGVTLDAGDDVVLAGGKSITGNGNLTLEAGDDILLGIADVTNHWLNQGIGSAGNVTANGNLILAAGDDVYAHGDLTATGGNITISASDDTINLLGDKVEATGNVNLQNNTVAADGILIKAVQGDVVVGVEEQLIGGETYYTDASLTGNGALTVEAGSDIVVGGDMETYGDTLLTAADSISVGSAYTEGGDLGMTATNGNITSGNLKPVYVFDPDGDLVYFGGGIEVDGGDMTLSAENGNISFRYAWAWESEGGGNMDMTAGGDITAGVIAPAVEIRDRWGNLKATFDEVVEIHRGGGIEADGDITLLAENDITATWINWYWDSEGEVYLDAGHDIQIGRVVPRLRGWTTDSTGDWSGNRLYGTTAEDVLDTYVGGYVGSGEDITLLAGNDIKLGHAQASQRYNSGPGDIIMDAGRDILVGGLNPYAVEVTSGVYETIDLDKGGRVDAELGAITLSAGRDISLKMAEAEDDITMTAVDNITLRTNQPHHSTSGKADRTESYDGDIRLHALNGDISIAEGYELIGGEFYYDGEVATGGGVSLIADNGKIYSPDGDDDTLNIYVEGSSSQLHDVGVELPGDETKKAAIVIISKENLKLGPDSALIAYGMYHATSEEFDLTGIDTQEAFDNYIDSLEAVFGTSSIDKLKQDFEEYLGYDVDDIVDFAELKGLLEGYLDSIGGLTLYADDRPAIRFLAEPVDIGGIPRDQGKPIDVAIYIASTAGNVDVPVGTKVDIWAGEGVWIGADTTTYVDPGGTMVVDAYDTVTFRGKRINITLEDFDWIEDIDDFESMLEDLFYELSYEFGIEIDTEDFRSAGEAYFTSLGYVDDPFDDPAFIGHFENFLEDYLQGIGAQFTEGGIVDRLEVSSRITEWLFQAAGPPARLPFAGDPAAIADFEAFIGGDYILRGAGLGNLLITDGRAWVLENPVPSPPLHQEAGAETEDKEFAEGGCPPLMNWLANEIGVPAEDIQVALAGALALNTDIQPCEMCARLMDAATMLEDAEGIQIAAMARVVNEFVTTSAPPSPEQMTSIAAALAEHVGDGTHYAAAGQWIDAIVAYVGIMNTEMGYSATDSVAFAQKYLTPITETGNAALTAYVQARLAALGG